MVETVASVGSTISIFGISAACTDLKCESARAYMTHVLDFEVVCCETADSESCTSCISWHLN